MGNLNLKQKILLFFALSVSVLYLGAFIFELSNTLDLTFSNDSVLGINIEVETGEYLDFTRESRQVLNDNLILVSENAEVIIKGSDLEVTSGESILICDEKINFKAFNKEVSILEPGVLYLSESEDTILVVKGMIMVNDSYLEEGQVYNTLINQVLKYDFTSNTLSDLSYLIFSEEYFSPRLIQYMNMPDFVR